MAQELLNDLDVDIGLEGAGGGAMTQIVEPDRWQSKTRDELVEVACDFRGMQFLAVGTGKDAA